jgi:hypothetical protein
MDWLLVAVPVLALMLLFGWSRKSWPPLDAYLRPDEDDGAGVREPRRPLPQSGRDAAAAADQDLTSR